MRHRFVATFAGVFLAACETDPISAPVAMKISTPATLATGVAICDVADYPDPGVGWPAHGALRESPVSAQLNPRPRTAIVLIHGYQPGISKCKEFRTAKSGEVYFSLLLPL